MDLDKLEKFALSYANISAGTSGDEYDVLTKELWGGQLPKELIPSPTPYPEPPPKPVPAAQVPQQPVYPPVPPGMKAGFTIPGYDRMSIADKPLQDKSMQLLPSVKKLPFGSGIPFTDPRDGQQYLAVHEYHPPSATIPEWHSGVSLFRPKQPKPQATPLRMFEESLGFSMVGLSENTKRKIQELDPAFRPQVTELMTRATAAGLRPVITDAHRSQEEQNRLFAEGRSPTRNSMHTRGLAVDIYQRDRNGKIDLSPEPGFYEAMSQIAASLGIDWGGNWKPPSTPDKPHFQYRVR